MTPDAFYRLTELDRTNWSELGDQVLHFAHVEPLGDLPPADQRRHDR